MNSALPKVLHQVCGKEMIRHVLDAVRTGHDGPLVVVVPQDSAQLRTCLGDAVEYIEQEEPRGTGDALLSAESVLNGRASHLLVLYGDTPLVQPLTFARLVEQHCAAKAAVTFLTSDSVPVDGLGRVVRDRAGRAVGVIEESQSNREQREITEVNGGVYAFEASWLWAALRDVTPSPAGEYYLTDLVGMAARTGLSVMTVEPQEPLELLGVDNRVRLAQAEEAMRHRLLTSWMLAGVTVVDPSSTYIDATVSLGKDTTIYPGTTLRGDTRVGSRCHLGPGTMVYDSVIEDDCKVVSSVLEGSHLEPFVDVGPFSHLRPGAYIESGAHIGNYAEVKNSRVGRDTMMGHFSYVGDAEIGKDVNIGAGVITCNFDGRQKNRTVIEDGAFIGSDTMLVAPVRVGARSITGAGSVVNRDVPPDNLVAGVPARLRRRSKRGPVS